MRWESWATAWCGRRVAVAGIVIALAAGAACSSSNDAATTTTAAPNANDQLARTQLSSMPAFRDAPWADDLKAEQDRLDAMARVETAYGRFSLPDFQGEFTNVSNSERRTLESSCVGCPERVVWVVGASAAFGLGQRDDNTVASNLVRAGDAAGLHLVVRNLAVPGTTFAEEVDGVRRHLAVDPVPPDLVVFYDGFNDVLSSYAYALVNDGATMDRVSFDGDYMQEFLGMNPPPDLPDTVVSSVAEHVATSYLARRQEIAAELAAQGIATAFFFQPDAFVSDTQLESTMRALNPSMAMLANQPDLGQLLAQTSERMAPDVHSLRPTMAAVTVPMFADPAHFNEAGAALMANEVFGVVRTELQ